MRKIHIGFAGLLLFNLVCFVGDFESGIEWSSLADECGEFRYSMCAYKR